MYTSTSNNFKDDSPSLPALIPLSNWTKSDNVCMYQSRA